MKSGSLVKLTFSALFLSLAQVLPFFTGQIPQIGKMLCPMHIPVLLCGFICGWPWGLLVGALAPLLRSVLFGVPVFFPMAISMAFELAAYGFLSGLLYRIFQKSTKMLYLCLVVSMIGGRIAWAAARFVCAGLQNTSFPFSAFVAGAVTEAIPGILLQLILVPLLVIALDKSHLIKQ